jgi:tRNA pseudouridine55 synthase
MVYAGRLDPMASGMLLLLTGADRFSLPGHLGHDKRYTARFLFGVASDTHDALGRLRLPGACNANVAACEAAVAALAGVHRLPMPAWSAFKVRGRPLHAWAREGRIAEVELPMREMTVFEVAGVRAWSADSAVLASEVLSRVALVRGSFRQSEARADWEEFAQSRGALVEIEAELTVSSGTYIRGLAEDLGRRLACGALLLGLHRSRVGPYSSPLLVFSDSDRPPSLSA